MSEPRGPRTPRVTTGALKRLIDCERRLWLSEHARGRNARSEHDDVMGERNRALEDRGAPDATGMIGPLLGTGLSFEQAAAETLRVLRDTDAPVRRPALLSPDGRHSAAPAFILRDGDALVIRDVRLSHRPDKKRDSRVRIAYAGWLARQLTGREVSRLEILTGLGTIVTVEPVPDDELVALAERALELMGDTPEPDTLMGHSHCQHCDHYRHCWETAEAEHRIEVLPAVTRRRAELLREAGITTFDELARCKPGQLPHHELREAAPVLLAEARSWSTGAPVWLRDPGIPTDRTPVWFDVESDADGERAAVPVYLWGLAVEQGDATFEPIMAELTREGDRAAWERFVTRTLEIREQVPNAIWVHWHNAESMWVDRYLKRYGAPQAFVDTLRTPGQMFDLHAAFERSVRLPVRGTSVKQVAPWLGFAWSNPDADAEWSIAQLNRARRTSDPAARQAILDEVARYNADDLWAMRVVWRWLAANAPRA